MKNTYTDAADAGQQHLARPSWAKPLQSRLLRPLFSSALLLCLLASAGAQGTIYTFSGIGNWTDEARWSPSYPGVLLPNYEDEVVIASGASCTVDVAIELNSVTIAGMLNAQNQFFVGGRLDILQTGTLNVDTENFLLMGIDPVDNAGFLNILPGSVVTAPGISIYNRANSHLVNDGMIELDFVIENEGTVFGNGIFSGEVRNKATGVFEPGCTIVNTFSSEPTGRIRFEIGGPQPCTGFDELRVGWLSDNTDPSTFQGASLTAGGILDIHIAPGFVPANGQTFRIIHAQEFFAGFDYITVTPSTYAASYVDGLVKLCTPPSAYALTGTGVYCNEATLTLADSELGVNYRLYSDGMFYGGVVAGTGDPLTFAVTDAGDFYTVVATEPTSGCTTVMTGIVGVEFATPSPVPTAGPAPTICPGGTGNVSATTALGSIDWYDAPTGGNLLGNSASGANFAVSPTATTDYYAQIKPMQVFNYTGATQTFTVPDGVTSLHVVAKGSRGGSSGRIFGGLGGTLEADLAVTPGQTLYIEVGGQGNANAGGYNGGGFPGNGGGGATDIRIGGTTLTDRVLVAGGGGGAGSEIDEFDLPTAGYGGGATATEAISSGSAVGGGAGTQSAGGTGGSGPDGSGTAGSLGQGGAGLVFSQDTYQKTGAGGGGYYGGGGGGLRAGYFVAGGGGGSSYAGPACSNISHPSIYQPAAGQLTLSWSWVCAARTKVTAQVAPPTVFEVTGGGAVCEGAPGAAIGLDDSQVGVSYQLQKDGSDLGDPVEGTGAPIGFGNHPAAGIYTVVATQADGVTCTSDMGGSATVTNPTPESPVVGTVAPICPGQAAQLSATASFGVIDWYDAPTGGTKLGSSASGENFPVSPTASTTYYAQLKSVETLAQGFGYTGAMQTFTVPADVTSLHVLAFGARGHFSTMPSQAGLGGMVEADMAVTPGDVLNIFVGGAGYFNTGGYNGGGNGSYAGGGATDIRIGGTALTDRVLVAGGGGGGGFGSLAGGGGGGGLTGGDAALNGGKGGSQSTGGDPSLSLVEGGALGIGGSGGTYGGGGGGGYYGGGAGGATGGGGGSSYTSGIFTNVTHQQGIFNGNGGIAFSWQGEGEGCASPGRVPVSVSVKPAITTISATNISACNGANTTCGTDDTYTANIVVTYTSKPADGTLSLSGADIVGNAPSANVANLDANAVTFIGVTLRADGQPIELSAAFSADNTCPRTEANAGTAPTACDPSLCSVSDIALANASTCNDSGTGSNDDDTFTADVTVTFAYAPGTGNLTLKRGSTVLATKAAADLACVTSWTFDDVKLAADGQPIALIAEFSDACTLAKLGLGNAPTPCSMQGNIAGAATICPGATTNLTVSITGGTAPYTVTVSNGTDSKTVSGYASSASIAVRPSVSGAWTLSTITDANSQNGQKLGSALVTLLDGEPPVARCKPFSVALDETGAASIVSDNINDGSSDNCPTSGNLTFAASPSAFGCDDAGEKTVTLTVSDPSGNTASCTASVTVLDLFHYAQEWQRTSSDGAAGDKFGWGLSLAGEIIVAGAPDDKVGLQSKQGSAYVFGQHQGGTDNWGQIKQIKASDGAAVDYFGNAISIDGNIVLVGAHGDNAGTITDAGSAYIFEKDLGGPNAWGQRTSIVARNGSTVESAAYDYFGNALSLKNSRAVVGASKKKVGANNAQGAVYIYEQNAGGPNAWGNVRKLTATDATVNNFFGSAVAQSGNVVWVGATGHNTNRGAVYLFDGANNWNQAQKLTASDASVGDGFGASISTTDGYALVGAPSKGIYAGAAYIFKKTNNAWAELKKLSPTAPIPVTNDRFGMSVALEGDYAYVSAVRGNSNAGTVYIFHKDAGGTDNWGQIGCKTASDAQSGDQFGYALAVSGERMAISANLDDVAAKADQGTVYIFKGEDCPNGNKTGNAASSDARAERGPTGSVRCWPSPFSDELTVERGGTETGNSEIQVLDAAGRLMMYVELPAGQSRHTLNTSGLRPGMYFVQVSSEAGASVIPAVLVR